MKALQKSLLQRKQQAGATMVEYALIVALIAIATAVVVIGVGSQVKAEFTLVKNCLLEKTEEACSTYEEE